MAALLTAALLAAALLAAAPLTAAPLTAALLAAALLVAALLAAALLAAALLAAALLAAAVLAAAVLAAAVLAAALLAVAPLAAAFLVTALLAAALLAAPTACTSVREGEAPRVTVQGKVVWTRQQIVPESAVGRAQRTCFGKQHRNILLSFHAVLRRTCAEPREGRVSNCVVCRRAAPSTAGLPREEMHVCFAKQSASSVTTDCEWFSESVIFDAAKTCPFYVVLKAFMCFYACKIMRTSFPAKACTVV
uniref:Uncharacterized protein n=1 Tax=Ixodes ricinus TaxID=34613 RepID=A0A6B0V5B5_IXORI